MNFPAPYPFLARMLLLVLSGAVLLRLLPAVLLWAAPFLLALLLAWVLEPAVGLLCRRARMPRWAASGLCTGLLAALVLGVGALVCRQLIRESAALLQALPGLISALPVSDGSLERWLYRLTVAAPVQYQQAIAQLPQQLLEGLAQLPARLSQALLEAGGRLIGALPAVLLFALTLLLATFFTSLALPRLPALAERAVPERFRPLLDEGRRQTGRILAGWLKAEFTLLCVTFACLTVGLLVLGLELPLLLAGLITLVDALPILGSGTVLLPWALYCLLAGQTARGIGLAVLFAAISLLRSLMEPRLLGRHMGLPPLAALAAMYVGFSAAGVAGLLLAPPGLVLALGLYRSLRGGQNAQRGETG